MKILYVITQSEMGGAQRYVLDLVKNIKSFDIVVAGGGDGELFTRLDTYNIKYYKLKNLVRNISPIKDILGLIEIYQLLKKERPDVLHLNSSKAGVLGAIAGKLAKVKKIIYTAHGFVFLEPLPLWQKWLFVIAEKFSAYFKDIIICVSDCDRQAGIQYKIAPSKKFVTIHNGIDINALNFLTKEKAKEELLKSYKLQATPKDPAVAGPTGQASHKLIGTIANFYPTKGLFYLIGAADIVCKKYPNIIFTIIGDGYLKRELESQIKKLKLEKNIYLVGYIKDAEKYINAFDCYVCSSLKEGFPYSLLTAMAAGIPIVSTNVGGIPEMFFNNSEMLVNPADDKELAREILKILDAPNEATKTAQKSAEFVQKKFSLKDMVEKTIRLY